MLPKLLHVTVYIYSKLWNHMLSLENNDEGFRTIRNKKVYLFKTVLNYGKLLGHVVFAIMDYFKKWLIFGGKIPGFIYYNDYDYAIFSIVEDLCQSPESLLLRNKKESPTALMSYLGLPTSIWLATVQRESLTTRPFV